MTIAIAAIWESTTAYRPQIIAFVLTTAAALIGYALRARVKLVWGSANNNFHLLKTGDTETTGVYSEKFYVKNDGKLPAEKVDVVFFSKPDGITVFSARNYETKTVEETKFLVQIPYISPKELIIIDIIQINKGPAQIVSVQCPDAVGKQVSFHVLRKYNNIINYSVLIALAFGAFYMVQLTVLVVSRIYVGAAP